MDADKIYVIDDGGIEAAGTHDELLKNSEIYRDIYESQMGQGALADG
jgi:ATP-binding cassette subfamily B protein